MAEKTSEQSDAIKNMIKITQGKCEADGRTLCSYFLSLALESLEDDTAEVDAALRVKLGNAELVSKAESL